LRLPGGVVDIATFRAALSAGVDVITPVPPDRWTMADAPAPACQNGGFLPDIREFDAEFFGISPPEARYMDPQQRLLLETTWEALEDAGLTREQLRGSATGVFIGLLTLDYLLLQLQAGRLASDDRFMVSGSEPSFVCGRISQVFDLRGPSMSITTASSSSLVATHLAVSSLRNGECDLAIAGGVNLLLTPEMSVFLNARGALSRTGSCRPFDRCADGIVRADGCAVVVLRRWADAQAAGDCTYAVITGTAANHNGAGPSLAMPSGDAQQELIRNALAAASVTPQDVGYVETSSAGSPLGDSVEIGALAAVFGPERPPEYPLVIGSVKAHFGHTDAAAGLVGLLRAAIVARTGTVSPQIHFREPNPAIPWDTKAVTVATEPLRLDLDAMPFVGVSSFGGSGSNAHAVLTAAPPGHARRPPDARVWPPVIVLSALTPSGLGRRAAEFGTYLDGMGLDELADVAYTAAVRRTHYRHRLAVVASDAADMAGKLRSFAAGDHDPAVMTGQALADGRPVTLMVCSGAFPRDHPVGMDLYHAAPTFRETMDRCDAAFRPALGRPVTDVLRAGPVPGDMACPALFCLQVALAAQLREWIAQPVAVVGDGAGRFAADHLAGRSSIAEAARRILDRGRMASGPSGLELAGGEESCLVDIGPRPALAARPEVRGRVVAEPIRPGEPERLSMIRAVARLHTNGVRVRWSSVLTGRCTSLPRYPWERTRYWFTDSPADSVRAELR
jgi:acyl transferase domain-containing protein